MKSYSFVLHPLNIHLVFVSLRHETSQSVASNSEDLAWNLVATLRSVRKRLGKFIELADQARDPP